MFGFLAFYETLLVTDEVQPSITFSWVPVMSRKARRIPGKGATVSQQHRHALPFTSALRFLNHEKILTVT